MAPEILKGQLYTQLVDTWAMGVVTYIMLCGFPPFDGDSDTDVLCNIMNISYEFPSPGMFPFHFFADLWKNGTTNPILVKTLLKNS